MTEAEKQIPDLQPETEPKEVEVVVTIDDKVVKVFKHDPNSKQRNENEEECEEEEYYEEEYDEEDSECGEEEWRWLQEQLYGNEEEEEYEPRRWSRSKSNTSRTINKRNHFRNVS